MVPPPLIVTTALGSYLVVYYSVLLDCISCFLDCFKYVHATRIGLAVFSLFFSITGNNKISLHCCPAHFAVCLKPNAVQLLLAEQINE